MPLRYVTRAMPGMQLKLPLMRYLILSIFLIIAETAMGQLQDYSIDMRAVKDAPRTEYEIHIDKKISHASVLLIQRDSSNNQWDPRDSLIWKKIREREIFIKRNKEKILQAGMIMDSLHRKYGYYSRDSIVINQGHPMLKLMDSIYLASDAELEKQENDRFVLHGTSVRLEIRDGIQTRLIGVYSPDLKSHTLIYNLMTGILACYRSQNPKILKTKTETSGY